MLPQTHASTRTPAWPGVGRGSLPNTSLAGLRPIAIAAHGIYLADVDGARVRGPESEQNKLVRATQMRQAWGSGDLPSKWVRRAKWQADLDGLDGF